MKTTSCSRRTFLQYASILGISCSLNGIGSRKAHAAISPAAVQGMIAASQFAMNLLAQANNPSGLVSEAQFKLLLSINKQLVDINKSLETVLVVLGEIYKELNVIPSKTVEQIILSEIAGETDTLLEKRIAFYDPDNQNYKPEEFLSFVNEWLSKTVILRNRLISQNLQTGNGFSTITHVCKLQYLEMSAWLEMMGNHAERLNNLADFSELKAALKSYIAFYDEALNKENKFSLTSIFEKTQEKYSANIEKHAYIFSLLQKKQRVSTLGCVYEEVRYPNEEFQQGGAYYDDPDYNPNYDIRDFIDLLVNLKQLHLESSYLGFDAYTIEELLFKIDKSKYIADITYRGSEVAAYKEPLPKICDGQTIPKITQKNIGEIKRTRENREDFNNEMRVYAAISSALELTKFAKGRAQCFLDSIETGEFNCL